MIFSENRFTLFRIMPWGLRMNSFDIAVFLGLAIAMGTGFSTGLIRSAITIVAYIVAMPVAVWVMSFVPPLTENTNSPLMQNAGFFLGALLVIGMVLGSAAIGQPCNAAEIFGHQVEDSDRGDFNWAWPLSDPRPLEPPVPARGSQGFWPWQGEA